MASQTTGSYANIMAPIDLKMLELELDTIGEHLIISKSNFAVYMAPTSRIPNLLLEIGRLRESTFRLAGEGTGLSCDIDRFDAHYLNLFIWDTKNKVIVGGYRLGQGSKLFNEQGIEGFYISSLFEIKNGAWPILRNSLELGRSFIVPTYQKKHFPLFLLWQGILHYLLHHPGCRYLIGPVSISKYYSQISKSVIVAFIKKYCFDEDRAQYFNPRTAFHLHLGEIDIQSIFDKEDVGLDELENFLDTIEPDHLKVPVLLKQYAKQNAKFIGFNLDPNFSGALDGLMLLDIEHLPAGTIEMLNK